MMIALSKGPKPQVLIDNAAKWTDELVTALSNNVYISDARKRRYGHHVIKQALKVETSNKCAYCEADFEHVCPGDIEHITPKSSHPDLCYEWSNLTIACSTCNGHKSDYDDLLLPLLDPYIDDPSQFLFALVTILVPADNSPDPLRSSITIAQLDLNRTALIEKRSERILDLQDLAQDWKSEHDPVRKDTYWRLLEIQAGSDREYALVVSVYLRLLKMGAL